MVKRADIIIIGGGISGVSIGYNLLKYGAKNVVLLEKDYITAGATGRCGAGIRQQWGTELNCILSKHSCEFFENAVSELEYEGDVEFHQGGYMMIVSNEEELALMKKNVALQNSFGIKSEILDLKQSKEIVPHLNTQDILATAFHIKDGFLNPFHTTYAYAEAFKRLGGEIYTHTALTGIQIKNGKIEGVRTSAGDIITDTVIVAAGGYTQQITESMAGVTLPLYSERHNILVTEPTEPALSPMLMSFSLNFYCQQTPHGSFIMGRTCPNQPRDLNVGADSSFPEAMSRTITKIMPPLRNVRLLRQWAGLYNMSPDRNPIYGRISETEGLYAAAGFSGHGFMIAPATGRIMTEIVLGIQPTLPWEKLSVRRFDGGKPGLPLEPSVV